MMWSLIPLAFTVWMAAPLGRAIARDVPDEVRPNRARFSVAIDALVILGLAIACAAAVAWWAGLGAGAIALAVRALAARRWSPAVIGAIALGIASDAAGAIAVVAIILLTANLLAGAIARGWREMATATLAQPLGAVITALLLSLTVA